MPATASPNPNPNALTGQPLDRRDGRAKVTGAALFAADQPIRGALHAVLVTSNVPSGRITRLDRTAAMTVPGVATIISYDNARKLPQAGRGAVEPQGGRPAGRVIQLFQDDRVHYNNQPVAVVVADTLEHARAAAALVRVTYAVEPPVLDFGQARGSARPPKRFEKGPVDTSEGDLAQATRSASANVEATYATPIEHHNPMEPHATIAVWDGPKVTLYDATQNIAGEKNTIARTFGLDPKDVRIVCPFVGGGFGCKGSTWSHVAIAAMAAQQLGRPVKLVLDRPQMWGPVGSRPMTEQRLALATGADGRLVATRHDVFSHTSVLEDFVEPSALVTRMLYAGDARATSHRVVPLNLGTPTFQRAPGESTGTYALECAMDEMAERAGLDPLDFRLRNYAERSPEGDLPWSSKSLRECYRLGAERFGWSRRNARPATLRDGTERIGYGMATATYPANRSKATARVAIGADGIALVQSGTQDLGTGTWTVMAQVAADALGYPIDKVRFELGDSAFPEAPVSGGSQSAASVAPAVQAACAEARQQLLLLAAKDRASPLVDTPVDGMTIENGWFRSIAEPAKREPVAAVMRRAGTVIDLQASAAPGPEAKRFAKHSFGAVFVEVRVDEDLGRIRVPRVVGVYDVGNRLNAKTANSQLMGGIVWGISMALFEASLFDPRDGRFVNANLSEYHVATNADIGAIDITFVDDSDLHFNPLGIRGIGEIGITGVAAAVANAVYNATGKRVRDLPITLDKVMTI